uniref:Imidazole glycerol phosphate synthase subunit HisH n=1 Tax=Candidatus Blochmannia ulcerosa (nom. nud.) TaxID=251541 RepID=D2XN32_9ENTR|nr:imidazole glycerol phosphate synthase HisH subunit [Candidatus Blochmannia ulcerosus]
MKIIIINTDCSNLFSVKTILKKLGYKPKITDNPNTILKADKLFLPGVGSAYSAMKQLTTKKLIQPIKNCNQPILGICLGMQLFGSFSEENNNIKTLNILDIPTKLLKSSSLPIPHMGWNKIIALKKHPLLYNITQNQHFYFTHSYIMELNKSTIAYTDYGQLFSSIIQHKNFFGVQFHPEKSGNPGIQLIKNFLEM